MRVDEHVWRPTRRGAKYVLIDLTLVCDGTGPAKRFDMIEGRSTRRFTIWLAEQGQEWRDVVEVVAMDGFAGVKTTAVEELRRYAGPGLWGRNQMAMHLPAAQQAVRLYRKMVQCTVTS